MQVQRLQKDLCSELHLPSSYITDQDRIQGRILHAIQQKAGDPDLDAALWTQDYVPLGIERVIKPGGAFPLLTEEEAEKAVQKYAAPEYLRPDYENYRSYTDAKAAANAELGADYHLGHLDFHRSRSRLEKRRGRLHPSRLG